MHVKIKCIKTLSTSCSTWHSNPMSIPPSFRKCLIYLHVKRLIHYCLLYLYVKRLIHYCLLYLYYKRLIYSSYCTSYLTLTFSLQLFSYIQQTKVRYQSLQTTLLIQQEESDSNKINLNPIF